MCSEIESWIFNFSQESQQVTNITVTTTLLKPKLKEDSYANIRTIKIMKFPITSYNFSSSVVTQWGPELCLVSYSLPRSKQNTISLFDPAI